MINYVITIIISNIFLSFFRRENFPGPFISPGWHHLCPCSIRPTTSERYPRLFLLEHAVLSIRSGLCQIRLRNSSGSKYRSLRSPERSANSHPVRHPRGVIRLQGQKQTRKPRKPACPGP